VCRGSELKAANMFGSDETEMGRGCCGRRKVDDKGTAEVQSNG